ncbi:titin, partial [Trichonephila inaurata madagascariensis]
RNQNQKKNQRRLKLK